MDNYCFEKNIKWFYTGGTARDAYLGKDFADIDIIMDCNPSTVKELIRGPFFEGSSDGTITCIFYPNLTVDILSNRSILKNNNLALGFDYNVNELLLDSSGNFIAESDYWRDVSKQSLKYGHLPKIGGTITMNIVLRGIRLSKKLGFEADFEIISDLKKLTSKKMDSAILLKNLNKMIRDGVQEDCFLCFKENDCEFVKNFNSFDEFYKSVESVIGTSSQVYMHDESARYGR